MFYAQQGPRRTTSFICVTFWNKAEQITRLLSSAQNLISVFL